MTDEQMPAVRLSVYWPDVPGHPNSLDVEWAQDNPGSLLGVVQALVGQLLPLLAMPVTEVTMMSDAPAPAPAPNGLCRCGHRRDRHGRPGPHNQNVYDPNGGACVVCDDPRMCASFVPEEHFPRMAGAPIAAGAVLKVERATDNLVPTTRAETPTPQLAGVAIDAFRTGDIMHYNPPGDRFQLPGWTKEKQA